MVQATSGIPAKDLMFFWGIPFDPPRARMQAATFIGVITASEAEESRKYGDKVIKDSGRGGGASGGRMWWRRKWKRSKGFRG